MKSSNEVHPVLHLDGDDTLHMTQRANGTWYYQRRIPQSAQAFFNNQKSIKRSLHTKSIGEARVRARQLSVEHDALFAQYEALDSSSDASRRCNHTPFESLVEVKASQAIYENIINSTVANLIGTKRLLHLSALTAPTHERESAYYAVDAHRDDLINLMQRLVEPTMSERDAKASFAWKVIEGAMENAHLTQYQSYPFSEQRAVIMECCRRSLKPLGQLLHQLANVTAEHIELPSASDTYLHELRGTQAPTHTETQGLMLSECTEMYITDRSRDEIRPKTLERYKARMRLMLYVLGDRPIETLKRADAVVFKDKLLRMPANLNKMPQFKGLGVDEVIALEPTPMATNTANDTLTDVSSFFDWCVRNEYCTKNSFEKLKVKTSKKASDERKAFTKSDLTTLFKHPYFQGGKRKHPYYYWLPVLALYTGARLNELCQLHTNDIRHDETNELWTITITNKGEDQNTKNQSSVRTIPLHPKLVELGFVDFVQGIADVRVFPELKKGRDGYGQAASKWFGRFRSAALEDVDVTGKTFHSFRHTFINELKQSGVVKSQAAAYVGHGDDSETFGRYGKAYVASALVPVLEHITFNFDIKPYKLVN